jgi:RNA polymerase primary sigma factor
MVFSEHKLFQRMPVNILEGEVDNKMISNFQIARELMIEKASLVEAVSQFPVSALWLLHIHEQQCNNAETKRDEESDLISESTAALTDIKKCYMQAAQAALGNEPDCAERKSSLTEALKYFPFSFHDLTSLVDVIVDSYHSRKVSDNLLHCAIHADSDRLLKRWEEMKRRNNPVNKNLFDLLQASLGECLNEAFLFLKSEEMEKILPIMIDSEHRWLRSREKLATTNSRLVLFIANQYRGGFLEFDDLVQEGQTGLLKAVDRYNHELGYKFSTYAGYWIRQAISRALSSNERIVRIPCGQIGVINKVFRARECFVSQWGREPSLRELADSTGLTRDDIDTLLTISQSSVSLEESDEDEENSFSPVDVLEQQIFSHPFGDIAQSDLEKLMRKAIKLLNPREAMIICGHFGIHFDREMTLKEIGKELNLTRERVRQIQVAALNKMKLFYGEQLAACL